MSDQRTAQSNEAFRGFYKVIAPLIMTEGVGDGQTTACVMAQAATIDALRKGQTLDKPTDELSCACPLLRRMAIKANDTSWWKSDEERTEHLRPLIPLLLDSLGSVELTKRRAARMSDAVVRELTPMRLEWIAANTKNEKLKAEIVEGVGKIKSLAPIVHRETAIAARDVCSALRESASAYASADAYAYAASADAYASADADASAYASAAYAYASAYASAASADADASAYADAYAQKLKYRAAYLDLFRELAAMKELVAA